MMGATFSMPAVTFNRSSTRSPKHQSATASGTWLSRDEATWEGEGGEKGRRRNGVYITMIMGVQHKCQCQGRVCMVYSIHLTRRSTDPNLISRIVSHHN